MKSPVEKIKDEQDWTIQDMAIIADISSMAAFRTIKAESKRINPKLLEALAEAGYEPEELREKYRKYRDKKRQSLLD